MTTSKLVTLDTYTDPFKARIVAGKLEAAGIPTYLNGETTAVALTGITVAATVKLEIAEEDVERAQQILTAPSEPETGIQTEPTEKEPPEDFNAATSLAERGLRAALIGLLLLPALLGIVIQVYSLWLLAKLASHDEEMESSYTWKVYLALAIDAVGLVLGAIYLRVVFLWGTRLFF
jgi:hypothetical protein